MLTNVLEALITVSKYVSIPTGAIAVHATLDTRLTVTVERAEVSLLTWSYCFVCIYVYWTRPLLCCHIDTNECSSNGGRGPCAHICTNTPGSFTCSCRTGYALAADGRGCNGKSMILPFL